MTDQRRFQKLCIELRNADLPDQPMCDEAANEIERLSRENQRLWAELDDYRIGKQNVGTPNEKKPTQI